ncbi:MAG: ABC transporter ATP-binding protein [Lachnospirales bacterium]
MLSVENLYVKSLDIELLSNINFNVAKSTACGIIGESGSGKTLLVKTILNNNNLKTNGNICYDNKIISKNIFGYIPQNPALALDPLYTIGQQILELSKSKNKAEIVDICKEVNLDKKYLNYYPHQLSGGIKQRVLIAMALINNPKIIIADEPTTSLDVTVQLDILNLIKKIQKKHGLMLLFISHDIKVIKYICSDVIVMYGGRIVEKGQIDVLEKPLHPYTKALVESVPKGKYNDCVVKGLLGNPIKLKENITGCNFYNRCVYKKDACKSHNKNNNIDGRIVNCILYNEV